MTEKPPLPAAYDVVFPRVTVDESDDSSFRTVLQLGMFAADMWTMGPDGPCQHTGQSPAAIARGEVREALLHLVELGLIDIDEDRLAAHQSWPASRESMRGL